MSSVTSPSWALDSTSMASWQQLPQLPPVADNGRELEEATAVPTNLQDRFGDAAVMGPATLF
jgi:hypothetical protein